MQTLFQQVFSIRYSCLLGLNNSTSDILSIVLSKWCLNSEIVLVVIVQLLYNIIQQLDCQIGQKGEYKPILIVKDIMEQT